MNEQEYLAYDATGLAALVRAGEVSAAQLAICAAERAQRCGELGAVVEWFEDSADLAGQAQAEAPFTGVPFLIKDLVIQMQGRRSEMGSRLAAGLAAPGDSDLMHRFRQAGLVTLGRTPTPEMGYNVATETLQAGICRNPWDVTRSPGGSSGG